MKIQIPVQWKKSLLRGIIYEDAAGREMTREEVENAFNAAGLLLADWEQLRLENTALKSGLTEDALKLIAEGNRRIDNATDLAIRERSDALNITIGGMERELARLRERDARVRVAVTAIFSHYTQAEIATAPKGSQLGLYREALALLEEES